MSPPNKAVTAGALPLKGMCASFTPVMRMKSSIDKWLEEPEPVEP